MIRLSPQGTGTTIVIWSVGKGDLNLTTLGSLERTCNEWTQTYLNNTKARLDHIQQGRILVTPGDLVWTPTKVFNHYGLTPNAANPATTCRSNLP